jgi:hypothetical protein
VTFLFCEDVQPIHVVPAKARTITTGLSFLKELERLSLTNNHLWLWVPARARKRSLGRDDELQMREIMGERGDFLFA